MNKLKEKEAANTKKLGMQRRFVQQEMQQKKSLKKSAEIEYVVYTIYVSNHTPSTIQQHLFLE